METSRRETRFIAGLALLAPVVFVVHVLEEAPTFVSWFNSLVEPDISEPLFLTVNGVAFLITVVLAGALAATREPAVAVADLAWLGFLGRRSRRHPPGCAAHGRAWLPHRVPRFPTVLRSGFIVPPGGGS